MNFRSLAVAGSLFLAVAACSHKHFDAKSATGFVVLSDQEPDYDFRAVAPEGVVVAVRSVPLDDEADLAFWTRAVTLQMREQDGYALLSTKDVRTSEGKAGTELLFGHDEDGKPFVYRMRLFLSGSRLIVVEAGGTKEQMERYAPSIDWMLANVRVT
jgi:hypothetical protein